MYPQLQYVHWNWLGMLLERGHAVARLAEALCYKRVQFPMVSLEFLIDIILPTALWPSG